jgi:drug/metabolite transporter (DMT)-like permease
MRGAMAMLGAIGLFIINDAMIKLASEGLPAAQTIGVRGVFATSWIILAVLASGLHRQVHHALEPRTVGRAVLDVASTFTYLIALFNMPMALAVAIGQTTPLVMLLLCVLFLREQVPWKRWAAMLVGFAAVLLVARPGSEGFTWWAALSLLATLCSALRDIYTRVVPQHVPSLIITLASAVAVNRGSTRESASSAPESSRSPDITATMLPQRVFTVGLPRRNMPLSTTSSCKSDEA